MQGPRHFDLRFEPNWWGNGDPQHQVLGLEGPLSVRLTFTKEGNRYAVDGRLSGKVRVRCDRCLSIYSHEINSDFRLLLTAAPRDTDVSELALSAEDMSIEFVRDDEIEIDHIVREQLYLALPMKLLCNEACRGLCPVCGKNLNQDTCQCANAIGHPAFSKLKELTFYSE